MEMPEGWKNLKESCTAEPGTYGDFDCNSRGEKCAKEYNFALDLIKEMAEALEAVYKLEISVTDVKPILKKFSEWK